MKISSFSKRHVHRMKKQMLQIYICCAAKKQLVLSILSAACD